LESSVAAILAIILALGFAVALGNGNLELSLYLVSLIGIGLLSTTGIVVSQDTFGPVSDNAAGIAEMSGEFEGEPQKIMVSLDAVGNTTKAITKGVAIGSAVIAAMALFAAFLTDVTNVQAQMGIPEAARLLSTGIRISDPRVFVGLLVGGCVPFLFSSLTINAVAKAASLIVE